jgi:hypothetical protein
VHLVTGLQLDVSQTTSLVERSDGSAGHGAF